MVNKELKSIGREKLLPAGIVLTGGTAKLPGAVDLAKDVLSLPAQTGFPMQLGGLIDKVDDPSFVTSVGLILWGIGNSSNRGDFFQNKIIGSFSGGLGSTVGSIIGSIKRWFEKFLP